MLSSRLSSRLSHVCDSCKSRKVKCHKSSGPDSACTNCRKKGQRCVYSPLKRKFKDPDVTTLTSSSGPNLLTSTQDNTAPEPLSPCPTASVPGYSSVPGGDPGTVLSSPGCQATEADTSCGPFYVDQLLHTRQSAGRTQNASYLLGANENYLATSSMSFFSDHRLDALSSRLGGDALKSLIQNISAMVRSRVESLHRSLGSSSIWVMKSDEIPEISPQRAHHLIRVYFENVHPLYPFLDRSEFENRAFQPTLAADLSNYVSWAALYYAVLAIGCEYDGGGSFVPGQGEAWQLFRIALDLYPRVLLVNTDIMEVQAITAMAVFSLNLSGTQIQGKIISEAARVSQRAFLNKAAMGSDASARSRTFWVVYYIEKTVTFHHGTTSCITDCDIGSPVPYIPESVFGDFDWFLTSIRFARLYSRAFSELFSISATRNSKSSHLSKINEIETLLEQQRLAIPIRFRPGEKVRPQAFSKPNEVLVALRIRCHYHELQIALHRLKLHVTRNQITPESGRMMRSMMNSARAVVELTRLISIEPPTPFFILIFMPLTALFILFDLTVHNPTHPESQSNLTLLESVAGYFSALEYATGGYFPASMLVEFATIARSFVRRSLQANAENTNTSEAGFSRDASAETDLSRSEGMASAYVPLNPNLPRQLEEENTLFQEPLNLSMGFLPVSGDGLNDPGLDVMDLFGMAAPELDLFSLMRGIDSQAP